MLRRLPVITVFALGLLVGVFATGASAACVKGVASSDTLRIRSGPDASYSEVGRIPPNVCGVRVMGKCQRGWCPVAYGNATGWASGTYLREDAAPPPSNSSAAAPRQPPPQSAPSAKTTGLCVHGVEPGGSLQIRAGPGPEFVLLYGFRPGTCGVRIAGGCRGVYCPVQYKEYKGWADRRLLR